MTIRKLRKVENYSDIWKTNFKVKTTCKLSRNIGKDLLRYFDLPVKKSMGIIKIPAGAKSSYNQ